MPAAHGECEQALAECAGRRVCQALSLDESLFCNWFKLLELQHDISDQIHFIRIPDAGYRFFAARLYDSFIACPQLPYVVPASFGAPGVNSKGNRQIRSP